MRRFTLLFCCVLTLVSLVSVVHAQQPFRITAKKVFNVRDAIADSVLQDGDRLGASFASLGSFPGLPAGILIGAGLRSADGVLPGLENAGKAWLLNVRPNGQIQPVGVIGPDQIPELSEFGVFGDAMSNIGDLDGDGLPELAIGAPQTIVDGGLELGAIYICFLDSVGGVRFYTRITNGFGGLPTGLIPSLSRFGSAIASVGDVDGNGVTDIMVSAPYDNVGGINTGGALYLLYLDNAGLVLSYRVINPSEPILNGRINNGDFFGSGMAWLGDLGGPGTGVLAVGAWGADTRGRVHLLSFTAGGVVNRNIEISVDLPLLSTVLDPGDAFGFALAKIDDLNNDGIPELAVSSPGDDDSNDGILDKGAVYILYLQSDGIPVFFDKISETSGGLGIKLAPSDFFSCAVNSPGDVDSDGLADLLIGARNKSVDGLRTGNFFLLKQLYCRIPTNPTANIGGPNTLEFNWEEQPGARGYLLQTRISGTSVWNSQNSLTNVLTLDTLEPGETYDWRIFTGCGQATSFGTDVYTVTMPLFREAGITPQSNPVQGPLIVQFTDGNLTSGILQIWSADGRLMHKEHLDNPAGTTYLEISQSVSWPSGVYWMELKTPDTVYKASLFQLVR